MDEQERRERLRYALNSPLTANERREALRRYGHQGSQEWTQDQIDEDTQPFICPVTGNPCMTEHDEHCEDYGCARMAGIDVDRDII